MSSDALDPITPSRTALLVMDYQQAIIEMLPDGEELVAVTRNLIRTMREHGVTVAYVRVAFSEGDWVGVRATSGMARRLRGGSGDFDVDSPRTQIPQELAPLDGDIVVVKKRVGPFGTTDLHQQLEARGIDTLVLAGISTSGVVLSTVRDAYDRDYRVIVVAEACADREADVHSFLTERVFPRQAEVMDVRELHALLH